MKKTIFLAIVFMSLCLGPSIARDYSPLPVAKPSGTITSLVVNVNVTIILVTHPNQEVQVIGEQLFMEEISIKQVDGKLVIDGNRKRNVKGRGVVYVPASYLQQIKINNAASIQSSSTLKIPILRIMINSNCKVHISTLGKVDFVENELYEVEYEVIEKNRLSTAVVKSRD